jgi:hypothetical protein
MSISAGGIEDVFLDVKELAVRKLHFRKVYHPGAIDFHSSEIKQVADLEVTATAELPRTRFASKASSKPKSKWSVRVASSPSSKT